MMQFTVLEVSQVIALHDYLIGKHEIQGMAKNNSLAFMTGIAISLRSSVL